MPYRLLPSHCLLALLIVLATAVTACSSTQQIETASPRAATAVQEPPARVGDQASVTVLVGAGETALPDAVHTLRFRVDEVHLKPSGGDWTAYPADVNRFELSQGARVQRTVLTAQLPAARYDSVAVRLRDVYVQFDANAGAPLTLPGEEPLALALPFTPQAGRDTTLRLVFEPGASLTRSADCRWFFLPFITPAE